MSRAYRIRVKESMSEDLAASDEICSDLEILEILPGDAMADLLKEQLIGRGFEETEGKLIREKDGITVSVDPKTGEVGIKSVKEEHVELETEAEGWGYDDVGPKENAIKKNLTEAAKADLARRARKQQERLQSEATEALEGVMADVRGELNDAVNAITREALKRKAAELGRIKELTEDEAAGTLTIKVEL